MGGSRGSEDDEDKTFRYRVKRNGRDFAYIEWARAATKHRISRERSEYVVRRASLRWEERRRPRASRADPRLLFVGDDPEGVSLEVLGVNAREGGLLIIHAMLLRPRFRPMYEENRRC